jgi:hypothetical protein
MNSRLPISIASCPIPKGVMAQRTCGKRIVPSWSDAVKSPAFSNELPAKGGPAMKRERKPPFDPKVFLAKVNGGRAISDYRKATATEMR